ncbi:glycoside hydrolase family 127 protein [Microbacterium sp. ET2]|uniref:glycoside hydrolase family 127 protein n=1 Tax=Microbacterium albipurpureum TaxID=3050384 RepID=UPI00259D1104|nr:beta-L-arabinofuranosidase domain-containing protein [Microbacterium sp. ET2 (Ac-2212)]WJL96987.1 glycoside hydrolase family 127 protein [Microbacterium sp. ET2 (Ac-2212)]
MTTRGFFAPVNTTLLSGRPLRKPFTPTGGTLHRWRQRNSQSSIPHGIEWMSRGHYLSNLERAADRRHGGFTGMHWMDSDLYKLLEAIAWDADGSSDAMTFFDSTTELLERAQLADGYLNSYYQVAAPQDQWSDFAFGHEMYLGGHLIQAGVAASRARGERRLLDIGIWFADHLWELFGPSGEERIDGHPEIELALVDLFRETLDEKYLELARLMLDRRGHGLLGEGHFGKFYCQDEVPFRERTELTGHAVRAAYLAIGATDIAIETGDQELLDRCILLWERTTARKAFLTGGIGSRHFHEALGADWELPPDRAYQETCASIAMAWWSHRLMVATGRPEFAEHLQRVTLNAIAASVSDDGCRFFYRNPLMQRTLEPSPPADALLEERIDIGTRASWYNTACCPPNLMRFFSTLPHLMAFELDNSIVVALPEIGRVDTVLSTGKRQEVAIDRYEPEIGVLEVGERTDPFTIAASLSRPQLRVSPDQSTTFAWNPGPVIVRPHPRVDAVRGQIAIVHSDVVYAVETADEAAIDDLLDLRVNTNTPITVDGSPHDGAPSSITVDARVVSSPDDTAFHLAPEDAPPPAESATVTLRPWRAWAQTQPTVMRVWLPTSEENAP